MGFAFQPTLLAAFSQPKWTKWISVQLRASRARSSIQDSETAPSPFPYNRPNARWLSSHFLWFGCWDLWIRPGATWCTESQFTKGKHWSRKACTFDWEHEPEGDNQAKLEATDGKLDDCQVVFYVSDTESCGSDQAPLGALNPADPGTHDAAIDGHSDKSKPTVLTQGHLDMLHDIYHAVCKQAPNNKAPPPASGGIASGG